MRLRGLEAARAALALELRDHRRSWAALKRPSEEQLAQLEGNVAEAWTAYDRVRGAGVDLALQAPAGVREAVGQERAARAMLPQSDDELVPVHIMLPGRETPFGTTHGHDGRPIESRTTACVESGFAGRVPPRPRCGPRPTSSHRPRVAPMATVGTARAKEGKAMGLANRQLRREEAVAAARARLERRARELDR
jgi:hypothetical protein